LPADDARYEFFHRTSYRKNEFMGEGLRIKTMTMRGEISQGLALPITAFPEISETVAGTDVTELSQMGIVLLVCRFILFAVSAAK